MYANGTQTDAVGGTLGCFCTEQKSIYGTLGIYSANFTDKNGHNRQACSEWIVDTYAAYAVSSSISVLINVVNTILKLIMVKLITAIKED